MVKMFIGNGFKEEETKIECIKMMMTWSIQIDPQCDWHVQYNQLCFQSLSESLLQSSKTMYGYLKVCQYKDEIQRINVSYLQYLEDYRDGTLTNLSSSIVKLQTIAKELESDRTSHVIVNGLIEQIEFMVTRQSTLSHLSKLDLPSYSAKTSVLCVSVKRLLKSVTGIEKVIYPKSIVDLVEQSHAYVTMCQCFMDAFMKKTDSLERNDLFTETLIELSLKTSQDYLARGETVFMGGIIEVFCIIETLCDEATTMLLDASLEKVEKEVSVFELRAQTYQSDKTRQIDLRSHLQSLKETNSELCEEIRLKDMKLDEMDVKLFIVESKMSSQTQQVNHIVKGPCNK